GGVPRASHAFADCPRPVDVRAAAGADDDRFRPEDVEVSGANIEADSTGDAIGPHLVHQQVRHNDPVVHLVGGFSRGFGSDRLVALAVDHDLPLAFSQIAAGLRIFEDPQGPLFELVYRTCTH